MHQAPTPTAIAVPRWLIILGSLVIAGHLFAVVMGVLVAPSGPWPTQEGPSMAMPPQFAFAIHNALTQSYLTTIKMTHNYHFTSNRTQNPEIYFEVRLKDKEGEELATLKFPDAKANHWVRHRHTLLAQFLGEDQPLPPPQSEEIAPPGQRAPTVLIWKRGKDQTYKIFEEEKHLVPRDEPVFRPSDWALLVARSYSRYLCRTHGAASAEIIRHSKNPLQPVVLYMDNLPAGATEEMIANFVEQPR